MQGDDSVLDMVLRKFIDFKHHLHCLLFLSSNIFDFREILKYNGHSL